LTLQLNGVIAQGLSDASLQAWAQTTSTWFQQSYVAPYKNQSRQLHVRALQNAAPWSLGVSHVTTNITNVRQSSSSNNNNGTILVYDQYLQYADPSGIQQPPALARLPFAYSPTNAAYAALLQQLSGFQNVQSPIAIPFVASQTPTAAPNNVPSQAPKSGGGGLGVGAIIGIAVGGAVLILLLCAVCCYGWQQRDTDDEPGYVSTTSQQQQPPSQLHVPMMIDSDVVSTMEEPRLVPNVSSAGPEAYGDQR
jgi:hypothetical protein